MQKTLKIIVASFVGLSFLAMAALCCCVIKAQAVTQKVSRDHCTSQQAPAGHECCLAKLIPIDAAHNLSLHFPLLWVFLAVAFPYIFLRPRLALKNVYVNGPPGPLSVVPLYLQSRSLRI